MRLIKRNINETDFSRQNLEVITKPSVSGVSDLKLLIKKFAPVICFHPDEEFMPVSVEWYLKKVSLVNPVAKTKRPVTAEAITDTFGKEGKYFLEPEDGVSMFGSNTPTKVYVHAKKVNDIYIDLQYWFLFAETASTTAHLKWLIDGAIKGYEGSVDLDPLGRVNGIWERVTVRVNNFTGSAEQVFFPQSYKGAWIPIEDVQRRGDRILVYLSKDNCSFYPTVGDHCSDKISFDLYSSQLDFCIAHESAKGNEVDFSDACELISAEYLEEHKPLDPFWLNFKHHWGNPLPDYLSVSSMKRLVPTLFDKSIEFLRSKELVDSLAHHLMTHFTSEGRYKSLSPKFRKCWFGPEEGGWLDLMS